MTTRIMTVDVEDYFQVSAFDGVVDRADWHGYPSRVEANTERLLSLFEVNQVQATFFVLGWIAECYPQLVRTIARAGHEVASHGFLHQRVSTLSRAAFRQDVDRSKKLLEDICGSQILGYRAPSFSIRSENAWAYDTLFEVGYRYSSSVYPISHDHYGSPEAPRKVFETGSGVLEVPLSTLRLCGRNYPISGGGFFRLYPLWLSMWALRSYEAEGAGPYLFYVHPWELDPCQPRLDGLGFKPRFRHYLNLGRVEARLRRLTATGRWESIARTFFYPRELHNKDVVGHAQISTG